jgi:hypothetical protein
MATRSTAGVGKVSFGRFAMTRLPLRQLTKIPDGWNIAEIAYRHLLCIRGEVYQQLA